jgi:hypothetical protein
MLFAAGVVVGLGLAVVAGQVWRGRLRPNATLATALSVLALVIAIIAAARSGQSPSSADAALAVSSTTITPTTPATPPSTTPPSVVSVPNVIGLPRAVAIAQVQAQGLKPDLQDIPLSNVPSGFVVSQTPLAASRVARGSTVLLMVASAA